MGVSKKTLMKSGSKLENAGTINQRQRSTINKSVNKYMLKNGKKLSIFELLAFFCRSNVGGNANGLSSITALSNMIPQSQTAFLLLSFRVCAALWSHIAGTLRVFFFATYPSHGLAKRRFIVSLYWLSISPEPEVEKLISNHSEEIVLEFLSGAEGFFYLRCHYNIGGWVKFLLFFYYVICSQSLMRITESLLSIFFNIKVQKFLNFVHSLNTSYLLPLTNNQ